VFAILRDLPEAEKTCPGGAVLVRIGKDVREKRDIGPAKNQVMRHIRPKDACRACQARKTPGQS